MARDANFLPLPWYLVDIPNKRILSLVTIHKRFSLHTEFQIMQMDPHEPESLTNITC